MSKQGENYTDVLDVLYNLNVWKKERAPVLVGSPPSSPVLSPIIAFFKSREIKLVLRIAWLFFFNFYLFIYLFLAVLGLRFCARAFSSCGKRGPLFIAVRGPLTIADSLVGEHRLSSCGSRAQLLPACGIFPDQGSNPCPLN